MNNKEKIRHIIKESVTQPQFAWAFKNNMLSEFGDVYKNFEHNFLLATSKRSCARDYEQVYKILNNMNFFGQIKARKHLKKYGILNKSKFTNLYGHQITTSNINAAICTDIKENFKKFIATTCRATSKQNRSYFKTDEGHLSTSFIKNTAGEVVFRVLSSRGDAPYYANIMADGFKLMDIVTAVKAEKDTVVVLFNSQYLATLDTGQTAKPNTTAVDSVKAKIKEHLEALNNDVRVMEANIAKMNTILGNSLIERSKLQAAWDQLK